MFKSSPLLQNNLRPLAILINYTAQAMKMVDINVIFIRELNSPETLTDLYIFNFQHETTPLQALCGLPSIKQY